MTQFNQLLILATEGFETMGFSMIVADSISSRHGIILSSRRFLEKHSLEGFLTTNIQVNNTSSRRYRSTVLIESLVS